jgi:hypothetical protein
MANIDVARQIYNWLLQREFTSGERAHRLASLMRNSRIIIPDDMIRNGKLINFFTDRPNIFGVVRDDSSPARLPSVYAVVEREGNRGTFRGRGGPGRSGSGRHEYVRSEEGQKILDKMLDAEEDAQMVDDAILPNLPPLPPTHRGEFDLTREPSSLVTFDQMAAKRADQIPQNINYGGKKKSKSKSRIDKKSKKSKYRRSARKSRSKKNRNRRNKTARKS